MAKKYIRKVGYFNTDHTKAQKTTHFNIISHINITFKVIQSFGVYTLYKSSVSQGSNIIIRIIIPILFTNKSTS